MRLSRSTKCNAMQSISIPSLDSFYWFYCKSMLIKFKKKAKWTNFASINLFTLDGNGSAIPFAKSHYKICIVCKIIAMRWCNAFQFFHFYIININYNANNNEYGKMSDDFSVQNAWKLKIQSINVIWLIAGNLSTQCKLQHTKWQARLNKGKVK